MRLLLLGEELDVAEMVGRSRGGSCYFAVRLFVGNLMTARSSGSRWLYFLSVTELLECPA